MMLQPLRQIIQEIRPIKDLNGVLAVVVNRVREKLHADVCSVFLIDPNINEYILRATEGLEVAADKKEVHVKLGEGLVGWVGECGKPINLEHPSVHPRYYHHPEVQDRTYQAFLGVPLIHQRRLLGVISVLRQDPGRFSEKDEAFLITLAAQISSTVAAAQTGKLLDVAKDVVSGRVAADAGSSGEFILNGVPSSPGVAFGRAALVYPLADLDAVPERFITNIDKEIEAFKAALRESKKDIARLTNVLSDLPKEERELFDAYERILDSPDIVDAVLDKIRLGNWAQGALKQVITANVMQFESLDDPYLRERAADIRDLGRRLLMHLQSHERNKPEYPENTILVGKEVSPTMLAEMPEGHLVGIISERGSTNSHVAILARALGVPTVMGVQMLPLDHIEGKEIIIDGYYGQIYISPSREIKSEFTDLAREEEELMIGLTKLRELPAETLDGHALPLYVNTGLATDIHQALTVGASGLGLFRTEVPFMMRNQFPTEDEQRILYRQLLSAFAPRPVMMRTLDVGGDKILPYFPVEEENPFLGWRGIRITLDHPEIFLVQVRAMLRAGAGLNNLHIMFPMVSAVTELDEAIRLLRQAYDELIEEGEEISMPAIGVMLEVPSAIYQADVFAKRVDFLSVGSNDLIQYLLAVDRNNARVANLYSSLHPAVLHALQHAVDAAHAADKRISICGEMAGEPVAALLLLAMGFDTLSMSATRLPRIKWVIRQFKLSDAQELLKNVLELEDALSIRRQVEMALEKAGLGGLIRAGR